MSAVKNVPEGWVETTLGSSIKIVGGGTPNTTIEEYWNGTIPWLSVVDFNNDNRWVSETEKSITDLGLQKSSTKLLNKGDLIISARGTVGALAQLKKTMSFNQSCYGIKEIEGVSDIDFLFYLIKSSIKQINRNTYGAVFDTITTKTFDVIKILLPPLPEQKSIAAILTAFDNKIELLQAQNITLEETAQTIFKEWFGKYQIGDELPEGWREGKLGEIVKTTSGSTPSREIETYYINGIYNWVKSKELNGSFIIDTEEKITEIAFEKSSVKLFPAYSVLIAMYGNTVGEYAIVSKPMTCNQAVCALIPNEKIPYTYLFFLIKSLKPEFINNSVGSAQQNISQILIKNTDLVYSELVIAKFHKKAQPLLEKILVNTEQIQTLTQTRDELLPKLMSGEIRVKM